MKSEGNLKKNLLNMKRTNWENIDEINIREVAFRALENIGSKDGELRDELILGFLYNLITEKKLAKDDIRSLLELCLSDKHLFNGIGELENDAVFNRSFSVLIVRWIIYYHVQLDNNLLNKEEMMNVFQSVTRYMRMEKDVRGYVEDGGWAHAVAHGATALRTLALCDYMGRNELIELLDVVREKVSISHYVYISEEAERFVMVIINILSRDILTQNEIIEWIKSFSKIQEPDEFIQKFYWRENLQRFLRALYFRLKFNGESISILNEIENISQEFNSFHNNMEE